MKKQILVLFGGLSAEHEISCQSAYNVINSLNRDRYDVTMVGITKEGRWLYTEDVQELTDGSWKENTTDVTICANRAMPGLLLQKENGEISQQKIDVVIPCLHGKFGEDGSVQGLLELANIPYVGCGVLTSAVGLDKISTKLFADHVGVCQARYVTDIEPDLRGVDETCKKAEETLGYPMFVKPSNAGSSQGITKANNQSELREGIEKAKKYDPRVLIEEFIDGKEIECAVLGNADAKATVVGKIVPAAEFYDFDAKYNNDASQTIVDPKDVSEEVKNQVRENALKIFKELQGRGLSRVDFYVTKDDNRVIFNEINTFPGFTGISMYPMLCEAVGYPLEKLLDTLIELAEEGR